MEFERRSDAVRIPRKLMRGMLERLLGELDRPVEVSVALVDDAEMARLNRRFLSRSGTTDVLAFRLDDESDPCVIGQIVISAQVARREAQRRGIPVKRELALYAVHGALHLLGHDDSTPSGRERMRRLEAEALVQSGLPEPQG